MCTPARELCATSISRQSLLQRGPARPRLHPSRQRQAAAGAAASAAAGGTSGERAYLDGGSSLKPH
jgi:hypothetical protein